jgi:hypothetical protein
VAEPLSFYDKQAQDLIDAIHNGTGTYANPQIVYEALKTQATQATTSAALSGDPVLDQLLQTLPTPGTSYGANSGHVTNPTGQSFSWDNYWNTQKTIPDDEKKQFESIGGVPVADPQFMTDIIKKIRDGDKQTASNWQKLLRDTNSYAPMTTNPLVIDPTRNPDGVWTPRDMQAYLQYLQRLAAPIALNGVNPDQKNAATQAFNVAADLLGTGTDISKLTQQAKTDKSLMTQIGINWLYTHPDQSDQRHLISILTNLTGDAGVAKEIQAIGDDPSLWQKFADLPFEALNFVWNIPTLGHSNTPFGLDQPFQNLHWKNITDHLTPDEQKQLGGAVQQMQGQRGWLTTLFNSIQETGTRLALLDLWSAGIVGPDPTNMNLRQGWDWTNMHKDSISGGVFGDQFLKDHPTPAFIFDFMAGFVTNPMVFLGPVGRFAIGPRVAGRIGRLTEGVDLGGTELPPEASPAKPPIPAPLSPSSPLAHLFIDEHGSQDLTISQHLSQESFQEYKRLESEWQKQQGIDPAILRNNMLDMLDDKSAYKNNFFNFMQEAARRSLAETKPPAIAEGVKYSSEIPFESTANQAPKELLGTLKGMQSDVAYKEYLRFEEQHTEGGGLISAPKVAIDILRRYAIQEIARAKATGSSESMAKVFDNALVLALADRRAFASLEKIVHDYLGNTVELGFYLEWEAKVVKTYGLPLNLIRMIWADAAESWARDASPSELNFSEHGLSSYIPDIEQLASEEIANIVSKKIKDGNPAKGVAPMATPPVDMKLQGGGNTPPPEEPPVDLNRPAFDNNGWKSSMSKSLGNRLDYAINPEGFMKKMRDQTLIPVFMGPNMDLSDRIVLMEVRRHPAAIQVLRDLHNDDGKTLRPTDAKGRKIDAAYIRDEVFTHPYFDTAVSLGGHFYNYQSHLRLMSPEVSGRMDAGLLRRWMQYTLFSQGFAGLILDDTHYHDAVIKIQQDVSALVPKELKAYSEKLSQGWMKPELRSTIVDDIYKELEAKLPAKFYSDLEARREKFLKNKDFLDQDPSEYSYVGRDPSTMPGVRGPKATTDHIAQLTNGFIKQSSDIRDLYATQVRDWYRKANGKELKPEDFKKELANFEKNPANKNEVDKHHAAMKPVLENLFKLNDPAGVQTFPGLMDQFYMAPFSTYDLVSWNNKALWKIDNSNVFHNFQGLMYVWKLLELMKPSTAMRASIGDDTQRYAIFLAFAGSPEAAVSATLWQTLVNATGLAPRFVNEMLRGIYSGFMPMLSESKYRELQKVLGPELALSVHRLAQDSSQYYGMDHVETHQLGHQEAYVNRIEEAMQNPLVVDWARAKTPKDQKRVIADTFLKEYLSTSKGGRAAREMNNHLNMANKIQTDLAALDAKLPLTPSGLTSFSHASVTAIPGYEDLYRSLPRRTIKGSSAGNAREHVLERIKYHQVRANEPMKAIQDVVNNYHNQLTQYFRNEEVRKMIVKQKIDQNTMDRIYRDPHQRGNLPIIIGPQNNVYGDQLLEHGGNKGLERMVDRFLGRYITGSRANGMERVRQWFDRYYAEKFPDMAQVERNQMAIARAENWMLDNTYQGGRSMLDAAMGKFFPFAGATNSMNQFYFRMFKSHPWTVGQMWRLSSWAEDEKNNPDAGVNINPLSSLGFLGDIKVHPADIFYTSGEGFGAFIPGLPPVAGALTPMFSQDSIARRALEQVPGWGSHLYGPGQYLGGAQGAIPSYITGLLKTAEDIIGVPPQDTQSQAQYDRYVRYFQSKHDRAPTNEEIKKAVSSGEFLKTAIGWLLPVRPTFQDTQGNLIEDAKRKLRYASTDADRDKIITQYKDDPLVFNVLVAGDPRITADQKGVLEAAHPEIIPYMVSFYGKDQNAFTDPNIGLPYLNIDEYNTAIQQERENTIGWPLLREARSKSDQFLRATGASTSSQTYQDYKARVLQPIYDEIANDAPGFYQRVVAVAARKDVTVELVNSAPISALTNMYALPQMNNFDTPTTMKMRNVIVLRDDTAMRIAELRNAGEPKALIDDAINQFHKSVIALTKDDPEFAAEMDVFHWSKWTDFLDVQVQKDEALLR